MIKIYICKIQLFYFLGPNKHQSAVTCLQFNSKFVITSSDDGTVKLWDVKNGKKLRIVNFTKKTCFHEFFVFQVNLFVILWPWKVVDQEVWFGEFELILQNLCVLLVHEMAPKKPNF